MLNVFLSIVYRLYHVSVLDHASRVSQQLVRKERGDAGVSTHPVSLLDPSLLCPCDGSAVVEGSLLKRAREERRRYRNEVGQEGMKSRERKEGKSKNGNAEYGTIC